MDFFDNESMFSVKRHNTLSKIILPFRSVTITRGASDAVIRSENNVVLQLRTNIADNPNNTIEVWICNPDTGVQTKYKIVGEAV